MSVQRSLPRRPAWLYPTGSVLTLRDGRAFEVVTEPVRVWVDPSLGYGGGHIETHESRRFWRPIPKEEP